MIYVLHLPADVATGKFTPGCIPSLCLDSESPLTTVHLLLNGAKENAIKLAKMIVSAHSIDLDLVDLTEIDVRRDAIGVQLTAHPTYGLEMGVQVYYMPIPVIVQKKLKVF